MKTKQATRSIRRSFCLPILSALIALSANACVAEDGSFDDFDEPALDELGGDGTHEFAEGTLDNSMDEGGFGRLKRCGKARAAKYQQCHDHFGDPGCPVGECITHREASCRRIANRAFDKCVDGDGTQNGNWDVCWDAYVECMNNPDLDYSECGGVMEECLNTGVSSTTTDQQSAKDGLVVDL